MIPVIRKIPILRPLGTIMLFLVAFNIQAEPVLTQWLPYQFDQPVEFIEKTQYDLVNTTNAFKVFGAEYRFEDELFVDIFAAWTDGEAFDHSANVMHRSEGNVLEELEIITVEERDFIVSTYTTPQGEEEFLVSYSLEHHYSNQMRLHAHWASHEISTVHDLYYYELRFENKDYIVLFLEQLFDEIGDYVEVTQEKENFICPKTYVKSYQCFPKSIQLSIYSENNNIDASLNSTSVNETVWIGEELVDLYSVVSVDIEQGVFRLRGMDADLDLFFVDVPILSSSTEEALNTLSVFPNPTRDIINIRSEGNLEVELYDARGEMHFMNKINEDTFDLSNLKPGTYYLRLRKENNTITKKVIVI